MLVVNEVSAFERSRERLYVGLSRARDQLIVCVLEVVGDTLAWDYQAVWLELFDEGSVDLAFGLVGKAGRLFGSEGHSSSPITTPHNGSTFGNEAMSYA